MNDSEKPEPERDPQTSLGNEDAILDSETDIRQCFLTTPSVGAYLNGHHNTVVGSKGVGKSAALMQRAIELRGRGEVATIPVDRRLVDFATGEATEVPKFFHSLGSSEHRDALWTTIWKASILRAVAHTVCTTHHGSSVPTLYRDDLRRALGVHLQTARRPYAAYAQIVEALSSAPAREVFAQARNYLTAIQDTVSDCLSFLPPLYVLIDNNDNYYESMPALATESTFGQFRAAVEIRAEFGHRIHVLNSMRSEIFAATIDVSEQRNNWLGTFHWLEWKDDELLEFLRPRIERLYSYLLREPHLLASNPIAALFGSGPIENKHTKVHEERTRYLLRHTMGRPRDLVVIGNRILKLATAQRHAATDDEIRQGVAEGAADIAKQYLKEVNPFLVKEGISDISVFLAGQPRASGTNTFYAGLPRPILTAKAARELRTSYFCHCVKESNDRFPSAESFHPFCALAQVGLVGWVEQTPHRGLVQHFRRPGSGTLLTRSIPAIHSRTTKYFALHPVLLDFCPHLSRNVRTTLGNGEPLAARSRRSSRPVRPTKQA